MKDLKEKLSHLPQYAPNRASVGTCRYTRDDAHASNSKKYISSYSFEGRRGLIRDNKPRMTIVTDGPGHPDVKIAK